jgi:hypothetical protein
MMIPKTFGHDTRLFIDIHNRRDLNVGPATSLSFTNLAHPLHRHPHIDLGRWP